MAVGLAEAGADVALLLRTEKDLNEAARMIEDFGKKALVLPTDVTKREDVQRAIQKIVEEWGGIDTLYQ